MIAFRLFLAAFLIVLSVYTGVVIVRHGPDLLSVFFGDMAAMGWPGQFNLDFTGFLILSALWTAWRRDFQAPGLLLAPLAFFGGMSFLTIYLLILSFRAGGDMRVILLGPRRAKAA